MAEKGLVREVGVGVSVAVLLAVGGAFWNWSTHGGLVRALGGVTANDEVKIVKAHILPDTHYSLKNDEQLLSNLRNKCDKRRYCDLGLFDNYFFQIYTSIIGSLKQLLSPIFVRSITNPLWRDWIGTAVG